MFTLDFLITLLVVYGIVRLIRSINAPKATPAHRPPEAVSTPKNRTELWTPPASEHIVDATFEELE